MTIELPYIDEHTQAIDAPVRAVWTALLRVLRHTTSGATALARVLACDPLHATSEFEGRVGDAVPGFRVVDADPGRRLALRGRHRFADYALTFVIDDRTIRAETRAAFPGALGRVYRAGVIGTGGHAVITRRLLRQIANAV